MKTTLGIVIGILILLGGCSRENITEPNLARALFEKPITFPNTSYKMEANPITEDGFQLGKKLFYDGKLSRDGSISCAECHNQPYAFTHHGHAQSHGIDDQVAPEMHQPYKTWHGEKPFFGMEECLT